MQLQGGGGHGNQKMINQVGEQIMPGEGDELRDFDIRVFAMLLPKSLRALYASYIALY